MSADIDIDVDLDDKDLDNTDLDRNLPFCVSHCNSLTLERSVLLDTEAQM